MLPFPEPQAALQEGDTSTSTGIINPLDHFYESKPHHMAVGVTFSVANLAYEKLHKLPDLEQKLLSRIRAALASQSADGVQVGNVHLILYPGQTSVFAVAAIDVADSSAAEQSFAGLSSPLLSRALTAAVVELPGIEAAASGQVVVVGLWVSEPVEGLFTWPAGLPGTSSVESVHPGLGPAADLGPGTATSSLTATSSTVVATSTRTTASSTETRSTTSTVSSSTVTATSSQSSSITTSTRTTTSSSITATTSATTTSSSTTVTSSSSTRSSSSTTTSSTSATSSSSTATSRTKTTSTATLKALPVPGPEEVVVGFHIENLDYYQLEMSPLLASVVSGLRTSIATSAGRPFAADDVALMLSPGSVVVDASLKAPNALVASEARTLLTVSPERLSSQVETALLLIPGLSAVSHGPVRVTSVQVAPMGKQVSGPQPSASLWPGLLTVFGALLLVAGCGGLLYRHSTRAASASDDPSDRGVWRLYEGRYEQVSVSDAAVPSLHSVSSSPTRHFDGQGAGLQRWQSGQQPSQLAVVGGWEGNMPPDPYWNDETKEEFRRLVNSDGELEPRGRAVATEDVASRLLPLNLRREPEPLRPVPGASPVHSSPGMRAGTPGLSVGSSTRRRTAELPLAEPQHSYSGSPSVLSPGSRRLIGGTVREVPGTGLGGSSSGLLGSRTANPVRHLSAPNVR